MTRHYNVTVKNTAHRIGDWLVVVITIDKNSKEAGYGT